MPYMSIVYLHLATVLPAFGIGSYMMVRRKGSTQHRGLGRIYMLLMLATGITTLFMPAYVGPRFLNHFGFLHLLSLLTLVSVPAAYFAVKRGDLAAHRRHMIGLYVGGLLIAGSFALLVPNRLLHDLLFA